MEKYKQIIQKQLEEYFEEYKKNSSYSSIIWDAMAYTTLSGGKRLRAIMTLETAKMFKLPIETALPLACSVEIMHAYSLIHDDLPCMDNDDLRRGKPTNHKIYGEAIATLAGDALISFGAQIIIDKTPNNIPKEIVLDIVKDYLVCAGAKGIIAGQVADIKAQDKKGNIENLNYIHKHKTADLFKFAILSSAKLACVDKKTFEKLEEFALNFGMLFQIYDDIIDCTLTTKELGKIAGKDQEENKLTYVKIHGLDKAKNIFYSLIDKNHGILDSLNVNSKIFKDIHESLVTKVKK